MDPFTLIGVAANLARVIIHLTYTYKLQATHVGILVDRITSLEKPLETLERAGKSGANKISEAALRKLIATLEEVHKLILEHQRSDNKSKAKRFLFGDANMDDLKLIRERLDSSLLDLQLAITVEEVGNSEKRVHQTARVTVDILMNAVTQRSAETILKCVQCSQEYRQSENAMGSCKYHTAFPHVRSWKHHVACCGKTFSEEEEAYGPGAEGCTRGVHCDFQHTQYPYSAYFVWMRNQIRTNVKEVWLRVTDWDFEDSIEKYAEFGLSKDNLLYVSMGRGILPLFLQYFDPQNMPQVTTPIGDMMTIAMRGTDVSPGELEKSDNPNKWIVDALWTLDANSEIHGIRLSANSMSSKFPVIKELSLSFNPLTKGDIRVLSFSGAPDKGCFTDALPDCSSSFVNFPDSITQPPPLEPNYETVNSGNLQVRLKKCEPCAANPERTGHGHDTFVLQFYVMNLSQGATLGSSSEERMVVLNMLKDGKMSVEEAIRLLGTLDSSPHQHGPITFVDTRVRFYYNDRWVNASYLETKLKKDDKMIEALPFEVAPRGATKVVVSCQIECPDKKKAGGGWFHRSYVARLSPITIEVTFEEMSGQTTTILSQYGNPPYKFYTPPSEDYLFFIYVDDLTNWDRVHFMITKPNLKERPEGCFDLQLGSSYAKFANFKDLLLWGYEAQKVNQSVWEITEFAKEGGNYRIWALIDLVAGVACGLKVQVRCGESYNEGIWMIPDDLFLASRRACIGDDVEKALWIQDAPSPPKPTHPPPAVPSPKYGNRPTGARLGTRPDPPSNPPPPTPTSQPPSHPPPATPPSHAPPSTPLPSIPTSNAPPSAQPSRAPPSAQGNGFVRTTPAPPPRNMSSSNGIVKPPATTPSTAPSTTPSSPALTPAPTPTPTPAPTPSTPAPAPSPAADAAATSALLASLAPPPLNQTVASPPPPAKVDDRVVTRCTNCSFGNKKDQCIKCKNSVPPVPTPAPGLLCLSCKLPQKGKCWTCPTQVGTKGVPAIVCSKCNFGAAKDKCIKCGKPT